MRASTKLAPIFVGLLFLMFSTDVSSWTGPRMRKSSFAVSCLALLNSGDNTSGIKMLRPAGSTAPIEVYCDMTTDGGGWMLVARSVAGGTGTFGWTTAAGSASNDAAAYSMGSTLSFFTWTSVLFGLYTSSKTWGAYAYKHTSIPSTFLSTTAKWYNPANQTFGTNVTCGTYSPLVNPTAVIGGNSGMLMASAMGWPERTDYYFFRDCPGSGPEGLGVAGWNTVYNDATGGNMNGLQGMIMVK
jgi:hypothetical protein